MKWLKPDGAKFFLRRVSLTNHQLRTGETLASLVPGYHGEGSESCETAQTRAKINHQHQAKEGGEVSLKLPGDPPSVDLDDKAKTTEEIFLQQALNAALALGRRDIDRAKTKSGICERCGEPIPSGRLKAVPKAIRCVKCQSDYDQSQRPHRQRR